MNLGRRKFLKILGAGAAVAAAGKGLEELLESPFDRLWEKMLNYNNVRNKWFQGRVSLQEKKDAWDYATSFADIHFPEARLDGRSIDDVYAARDFFEEHKKLYYVADNINYDNYNTIILGSIIGSPLNGSAVHGGETVDYRIITFEQEAETVNDVRKQPGRIANWSDHNNTVFINLTKTKKWSREIYNKGKELEGKNPSNPKDKYALELYNHLRGSIQDSPFSFFTEYNSFEKKFTDMIISSYGIHESAHCVYGQSEIEAYSAQASFSPAARAWVLYTLCNKLHLKEEFEFVKEMD